MDERDAALLHPQVTLTYWRPQNGLNFGDSLSLVIVQLMLASRGLTLLDETAGNHQLLAIGSILHLAKSGAVVWGSGVNGKIATDRHGFSTLDVRAVRGPLTRDFLSKRGIAVPEIYGDPALLLPHLAKQRFNAAQREMPAFVPNLNDLPFVGQWGNNAIATISPMQSWNKCVSDILSRPLILASSLHGIIVAEAFGIPARYLRLTENEHLFKYRDYYEGTGRPDFSYARSFEEAMEMGGERSPIFDPKPLLGAFPFDLWMTE
jgi:pyruvyltransferase